MSLWPASPPSLSRPPAALSSIYEDDGADAGRLRSALLGAVLRLTPYTMAANMGCALIVLWAFADDLPTGMAAWAAAMIGMAGVALRAWWRGRGRLRETASRRAVRRATLHAAALATLWAVVPLAWFPGASASQQVQVATVVTGMMGAGAFLLNPLPRACLAYIGIFSVAATSSLLIEGNPALYGIVLMIAFYATVLALGALAAGQKHVALLRSQAETARQQRMLALLLQDFEQHADEALWQTDREGRISHASPRLAELLGGDAEAVMGRPLLDLLREAAAGAAPAGGVAALPLASRDGAGVDALARALADVRTVRDLPLVVAAAGRTRHLVVRAKRVFDDAGQPEGWRGVLADVTERVLGQQRLQQLAHTDALTGLDNRLTLRHALARCLEDGRRGALMLLDLDDFKAVNDTLGHTAGDALLRSVAARLRDGLRPGDAVARLGGDEFAVLTHGARAEDAETLALRLLGAIGTPHDVQGRRVTVGISIGVAAFGADGPAVDELFIQADTALYAAKGAGRGRHVVYTPALGERSERRLAIERALARALQRGELALHWQPRVDIGSWRIVGAEALLRWPMQAGLHGVSDDRGAGAAPDAIGAAELVAVAEQCGLAEDLGRFVLQRACAEAAASLDGLAVSVNVSPVQLRQAGFADLVRESLRASGLPPAQLELEVTEALFDDDAEAALRPLRALRELGVRVALDDFGRGPSSLACLRRFPFDTLKIDPALMTAAGLRGDGRDDGHAIVHTLTRLARTLRMRTVCEGVETAPQLAAMSAAGCEQVQGFVAARPRPLAQFTDLLDRWPSERPQAAAMH